MERIKGLLSDSESLIMFGVVVVATIIIALLVGKFLQREITKKAKSQNIDITSFIFLKHLVVTTIYFAGFGWALLTLPITHTFAHSLLAGAGATTLILGFASQQLFTNLLSGVFLIIGKPFSINDTVEFQGSQGKVIAINLNAR